MIGVFGRLGASQLGQPSSRLREEEVAAEEGQRRRRLEGELERERAARDRCVCGGGGREEERAARDRCVCVWEGNWRGRGQLETGVCGGRREGES